MADTFILNFTIDDSVPTTDVLTYPGATYLETGALFGMFNDVGSYRNIAIRSVEVCEVSGITTTAQVNHLPYRITALTGGDTVVAAKLDSNAASIPSQVSLVKNATSITTTGAQLRASNILDANSISGALRGLNSVNNSGWSAGMLRHTISAADANVQGQVLREGQGFAITTSNALMSPFAIQYRIFFNIGTDTYVINEVIVPTYDKPPIAILNGSGSGVVITIARVEAQQLGSDDSLRKLSFQPITYLWDGGQITPIPMDSTNGSLPVTVRVRKNCAVTIANQDAHIGGRAPRGGGDQLMRNIALPYFGVSPGLSSGAFALQRLRNNVFNSNRVLGDQEFVLREGQGFCVAQTGNGSSRGNYEISITFTSTITGSAGGGGEHSYVF